MTPMSSTEDKYELNQVPEAEVAQTIWDHGLAVLFSISIKLYISRNGLQQKLQSGFNFNFKSKNIVVSKIY